MRKLKLSAQKMGFQHLILGYRKYKRTGGQAGPPKGPLSSKFLKSQNRFLQAASNVNVIICKFQKLNKHELNFLQA